MLSCRRIKYKVKAYPKKKDDDVIDQNAFWYKLDRPIKYSATTTELDSVDYGNGKNTQLPQREDNSGSGYNSMARPKQLPPKIYACATFWHETTTEMIQLLKSIHRMDCDQYLRKTLQQPNKYDPSFYDFEAHIIFDDAMCWDKNNNRVPNEYVERLVALVSEACSSVHRKPIKVHDPVKMVTPYGGQLVWQMPGENLLFVHLKDLKKIRNRKRWSQVMYMYYLLDYRLKISAKQETESRVAEINRTNGVGQELNEKEVDFILENEHAVMATNTFILALDGDTGFNPSAVRMLLERMEDQEVAAVCGRIHPVGNGPMVSYQKFEYAIGHWLQKASEHVFGCVLCSPGCFSLFRADSLMDKNVVKRYTNSPTEAAKMLQYDQGEDRWLCTLLLQRGHRIEYAAGADAWTYAPEGFYEFFKQRRRWMPSTIANILDLLSTSEFTRSINSNISLLYILYTWLLMMMTLLGPGTILMMIAGALQLIFKLDITGAYLMAVVPAAGYTVACFWLKQDRQLLIAAILSVFYVFVMLVVFAGTLLIATTESLFHPSVVIMLLLGVVFVFTALFHPKEWKCLFHAILYMISIPTGYLILVIYSICNMNDISWGTREVLTQEEKENQEAKKKEEEEKKAKEKLEKGGFFKRLIDKGEGSFSDFANVLKSLVPKTEGTNIATSQSILEVLERIETNTKTMSMLQDDQNISQDKQDKPLKSALKSTFKTATEEQSPSPSSSPAAEKTTTKSVKEQKRKQQLEEDDIDPAWTHHKALGKGHIIKATQTEVDFWKGLMKTYLFPIHLPDERNNEIRENLRELRNMAVFGFVMINAVWMGINFMFQYTEAAKVYFTYSFGDTTYHVEESILGMLFVIVLGMLLLLQFCGMLLHRMGVLQQLMATTKLWGAIGDVRLQESSKMENAVQGLRRILLIPAYNDAGLETHSPLSAEPRNPLSLSIRPNVETGMDVNHTEDMGRSINIMGRYLESSRNNNVVLDPTLQRTMQQVHRRLDGSMVREGMLTAIGRSYRPNLPPRRLGWAQEYHEHPNASRYHHQDPHQHPNRRMTANEIRRLHPNHRTIDSPRQADDMGQFQNMGALGRSLFQRTNVIRETQMEMNAHELPWTREDLGPPNGNIRNQQPSPRRWGPRHNGANRVF